MTSPSSSNDHVRGYVAQGWERIRTAFEQNFIDQLDIGASLCIYHRGTCVVDLCGGWKDTETKTEPYTPETLQLVFSTSKGVIAAAIALCVERGWLHYDHPVARYWPEFAANGKQNITIGDLLAHRAGLPYIDRELTLDEGCDWSRMTSLLAAQKPHWEPGSGHGYHSFTLGYIAGELICRVDPLRRTYGQFVRDELDRDFYVGVPNDEIEARVSPVLRKPVTVSCSSAVDTSLVRPKHPQTDLASTCNGTFVSTPGTSLYNDPRLHRAQLPAVNGISHARSLARIYAQLIGDVHEHNQTRKCLVSKDTLAEAAKNITPAGEPDRNWYDLPSTFSKGAFQTYGPCFDILGDEVFGHSGYGGSCAFAFPPRQLAYAYVCNYLDPAALTIDPRTLRIVQTIENILREQDESKS